MHRVDDTTLSNVLSILAVLSCLTAFGSGCDSKSSAEPEASESGDVAEPEKTEAVEDAEPEFTGPDFDALALPERTDNQRSYPGPCAMTMDSPEGGPIEQLFAFQYRDEALERVATVDDPGETLKVVQCETVDVSDDGVSLGSHSKSLCEGILRSRTDFDWKKDANAVHYKMSGSVSVENTILLPKRHPAYLFGGANVAIGGDVSIEASDGRVQTLRKSEPEETHWSVEYGPHGVSKVTRVAGDKDPEDVADMNWDEHGNLLSVHRRSSDGGTTVSELFYGCWE